MHAGSGGKACGQGYICSVTIQSSGRSVAYVVYGLSPGLEYRMVAWLDWNGDGGGERR